MLYYKHRKWPLNSRECVFTSKKTASSPHVFKVTVSVASLALLLRKSSLLGPILCTLWIIRRICDSLVPEKIENRIPTVCDGNSDPYLGDRANASKANPDYRHWVDYRPLAYNQCWIFKTNYEDWEPISGPAQLHSLAELVPCNRFLGSLKV